MSVRINHGVNVSTKLHGVNWRGLTRCIGDCGPRNEATAFDGAQFPDRSAIATDNEGSAGLHFAKYCGGLVAKFALSDDSGLHAGHCSRCSAL